MAKQAKPTHMPTLISRSSSSSILKCLGMIVTLVGSTALMTLVS